MNPPSRESYVPQTRESYVPQTRESFVPPSRENMTSISVTPDQQNILTN